MYTQSILSQPLYIYILLFFFNLKLYTMYESKNKWLRLKNKINNYCRMFSTDFTL